MITNWTKKREGCYKGFIIFLQDEEETTEICDGQTWSEWIASHFTW